MIQNIVILGAGNVACHLGKALYVSGYNIQQVISRNIDHAISLAEQIGAQGLDQIQDIITSADLYILAVNDSSIEVVASQMPSVNGVVVHTSGSMDFEWILKFQNYGSFYPFQTFSKTKEVNFKEVQILFEGNSIEVTKELKSLAFNISNIVMEVQLDQRVQLHIAAVFANNFVNHIYSIANSILKDKNLPFYLLIPLIQETTDKVRLLEPQLAQTGPAIRGDNTIINKHLDYLKYNPDYQQIYNILSKSIQKEIQ